jgi:calcineurin-like phosphoesterase family protein
LATDTELNQRFLWVGDYLEVYWGNKLITFAHYPIASWRDAGQGSWMVHGHSHSAYVPGKPETKDQGKILDVGWDVFNRPITMHEVSDIMDSKQFVQVDHHNPSTT